MSNVRKEMETHIYMKILYSVYAMLKMCLFSRRGGDSVCVYERQRETTNKQALLYAYDKTRGHTGTPHTA